MTDQLTKPELMDVVDRALAKQDAETDAGTDAETEKPAQATAPIGASTIAHDQLHAFIQRIERLSEEKAAIAADIKEIYLEAKGTGFDVKIMRKVVSLRKKETAERQEENAIMDLYLHALGMALD